MPKEIGGVFKKDGEVLEISRYEILEDSYVCQKLNSIGNQTRTVKEERSLMKHKKATKDTDQSSPR